MARIGYAKVGRSWNLNPEKATSIGGDIDVINCLKRLATEYPEHTFVLVGKNSGEDPADFGYPSNIENPWTEWKKHWTVIPNPEQADMMIDHFRKLSGNFHETLDHMIVWAGQHGSANSRIPMIGSDWTMIPGGETFEADISGICSDPVVLNDHNDIITGGTGENLATPQFAFVHYVSWLLDFISRWREAGPGPLFREEIWLCPDPRNYLKCREKRWPLRYPVMAQFNFLRYHKGERYGRFPASLNVLDPTGYRENSLWVTNTAYCYSGLELTAVGDPSSVTFDPRPGPHQFGMVVNENLKGVKDSRLALLQDWILPNFPDAEIRGHWTADSQLLLKRIFEPVPYPEVMSVMKSFSTTITTPASGSEWATAKPWEAFAIGSVCFFHPRYDGQGHILPLKDGTSGLALVTEDSKMLAQYLRVNSPEQLKERVEEVTNNKDLYYSIVTAQRRHYELAFASWKGGVEAIGQRINFDLARIDSGISIPETDNLGIPWVTYTQPEAAQVQSRLAARPRGTNEERKKKKPPTSRRRALKNLPPETEDVIVEQEEEVVEASIDGYKRDTSPADDSGYVSFVPLSSVNLYNMPALSKAPAVIQAVKTVCKVYKDEEKWPRRFLALAAEVASWSKDPSTKCGCVLVDDDKRVISVGYNGFPDRIADDQALLDDREEKRKLVIHSEMNAILNCPLPTRGLHAYVTHPCCGECAKMLIGAGIASFTTVEGDPAFKDRWACDEAERIFKLANVPYKVLSR